MMAISAAATFAEAHADAMKFCPGKGPASRRQVAKARDAGGC
jgi:hypothetical protein